MKEVFVEIKGFENRYRISNLGRVFSIRRNIFLKQKISKHGYYCVGLYNNNGITYRNVHRLVAEAFIPNMNNYPCVNHKDENKLNNAVNNLEWCTFQYNTQYSAYRWSGENNVMKRPDVKQKHKEACKRAHLKESFPVKCLETAEIYPSIREAERLTGVSRFKINQSIKYNKDYNGLSFAKGVVV